MKRAFIAVSRQTLAVALGLEDCEITSVQHDFISDMFMFYVRGPRMPETPNDQNAVRIDIEVVHPAALNFHLREKI